MYILFICTGNVSRSPVAACILRTMAEQAGRNDIIVDSAGVHDLKNQPYDPQMIATAARHGYHLEGLSQHMTDELLIQADLIFVMEHYHYVQVQKDIPYAQWDKLKILNEYCYGEKMDIEDPLYSDNQYEFIFNQIESCCRIIMTRI